MTAKTHMKRKGKIFIISSPSGGGKTTVCNILKKQHLDIKFSVSATTRNPRAGEKNDKDYIFLTKPEFIARLRKRGFLEWANNYGNLYGTPRDFVKKNIVRGKDVVLSIDVKGAMQVKKVVRDAVLIFILPPSMGVLKKRLKSRNTEGARTFNKRMKVARKELTYLKKYNYVIVNDSLAKAVEALKAIIVAERNKIMERHD